MWILPSLFAISINTMQISTTIIAILYISQHCIFLLKMSITMLFLCKTQRLCMCIKNWKWAWSHAVMHILTLATLTLNFIRVVTAVAAPSSRQGEAKLRILKLTSAFHYLPSQAVLCVSIPMIYPQNGCYLVYSLFQSTQYRFLQPSSQYYT